MQYKNNHKSLKKSVKYKYRISWCIKYCSKLCILVVWSNLGFIFNPVTLGYLLPGLTT